MTATSRPDGQDGDRLDSWKEIAAYLGKDVRTALRWSKDSGMPVYRHAGSKRGAVYAYRSEIDEWIHSDRSGPSRASGKKALGWTAGLIALILAAAFLWSNRATDQPNVPDGERPWVLITDFVNRSGEPRFDGTVETALRRELASSRHVLVVAPERVRDTLALMKRAPDSAIDMDLGREICLRSSESCALLTGRVEKFDTRYLFSIEVVDPNDGRTIASTAEEAAGDAGVLPAIHYLANWLRENLGEELARISFSDTQLEKVTSPSLRALEHYSRGMKFMLERRFAEAENLFRQAAGEDPGFASANLFLFWALYNQGKGDGEEALSFLERAKQYAGSVTDEERYFIEGTYFDLLERDYAKACGSYRTLAEVFPDHYWAAGNAAHVCGGKLGLREEYVRYVVQGVEQKPEWAGWAAETLYLVEGDFERARPYVERIRDNDVDENGRESRTDGRSRNVVAEFFAAEEYFHQGRLQDVLSELHRVEKDMESSDSTTRRLLAWRLADFHLALGQFQKAEALGGKYWYTGLQRPWLDFLAGDQSAFQEQVEVLRADLRAAWPDRIDQLIQVLQWNMWSHGRKYPLDVLVPLYDPASAVENVLSAGEPTPEFLAMPAFEAKLKLARGKQMMDRGRPDEAIALLKDGVAWFRDRGHPATFPYYFLGAELRAVALLELGEPEMAYRELEDAAGQTRMVNSYTAPQHLRVKARLASLARDLGRFAEAEAIESELKAALAFADEEHPIVVQLRKQGDLATENE